MKLYFSPLACSMASRMTAYEAGLDLEYVAVDLKGGHRLPDGGDFYAVTPMGQVPALETAEGEVISENAAVLQYLADRKPERRLAPPAGSLDRYKLQQWLTFIGTELHKQLFIPLLDPASPEGARDFARLRGDRPLGYLNSHLSGRDYLLDALSVADAYLLTILNWGQFSGVDLSRYPAITAYQKHLMQRPQIARAMAEEAALYAKKAS